MHVFLLWHALQLLGTTIRNNRLIVIIRVSSQFDHFLNSSVSTCERCYFYFTPSERCHTSTLFVCFRFNFSTLFRVFLRHSSLLFSPSLSLSLSRLVAIIVSLPQFSEFFIFSNKIQ